MVVCHTHALSSMLYGVTTAKKELNSKTCQLFSIKTIKLITIYCVTVKDTINIKLNGSNTYTHTKIASRIIIIIIWLSFDSIRATNHFQFPTIIKIKKNKNRDKNDDKITNWKRKTKWFNALKGNKKNKLCANPLSYKIMRKTNGKINAFSTALKVCLNVIWYQRRKQTLSSKKTMLIWQWLCQHITIIGKINRKNQSFIGKCIKL